MRSALKCEWSEKNQTSIFSRPKFPCFVQYLALQISLSSIQESCLQFHALHWTLKICQMKVWKMKIHLQEAQITQTEIDFPINSLIARISK